MAVTILALESQVIIFNFLFFFYTCNHRKLLLGRSVDWVSHTQYAPKGTKHNFRAKYS